MSVTPFSNTGGLERSMALSEYTATIDQVAEPYFNTLTKFTRHARKLQLKDEEGEKKLLEYLPVNERMSLEKEQKVLARWQERQKDWERIENAIGKKITAKLMGHRINKTASGKPLMMTTTDEYRAKMEEYDLIQAAIPIEDKFAENWQMSLRGGGAIHVAVGHIFSGLECEIDMRSTAPKMVRKPKPLATVGKADTFLEETDNLKRKRKKYEKNIATIRPHAITYKDVNNLVVKSKNLFEWAQESSQQYINAQKELLLNTLMEEEAMQEKLREEQHRAEAEAERLRALLAQNKGPKLEFLSPLDVLFETEVNKTTQRSLSFRNIGTTTLYYRWKRLKGGVTDQKVEESKSSKKEEVKDDSTQASGNGEKISNVLDVKGRADPALLTRVLNQQRDSFFCLHECGEILPGETIETIFTFDSRAGGGIFYSDWLLEITPDESRIVIASAASAKALEETGSKNSTSTSNIKIGCITVHLHGHCIVPDQAMLKREHITNSIDRHTVYTSVQDIVLDCIRHVRTPLRPKEIEQRVISYFQTINKVLFKTVFPSPKDMVSIQNQLQCIDNTRVYDSTIDVYANENDLAMMPPLFVTIARIREFEGLHHRTAQFYDMIYRHYEAVLEDAGKQEERIDIVNEFSVNTMKYNHIMATVFPEMKLECFDEVEMSQIEPHWPYDISLSTNVLNKLRPVIAHIEVLEQFIAKRNAEQEKARLRAERLAQRKANGDSDDEEEEEEEEPEEDEKPLFVKKHAMLVALNDLYGEILSKLQQLTLHPLSFGKVEKVVNSELCHTFDKIIDFQEDALKQAGIFEAYTNFLNNPANGGNITGLIPIVPNPFENEENAEYWNKMLALTTPTSEPAVPDKKAAKPAKNAPPPATATPQQCDYYHKILYENIRSGILDAMDRVLDTSMPGIKEEVTNTFHVYSHITAETAHQNEQPQPDTYASTISKVATYRKDDVEDAVVFYSIDADVIVNPKPSAFDVRSLAINELAEEVLDLIKSNVKVVTLLYESPYESGDNKSSYPSLQDHVESIRAALQKQYEEYQLIDQKQRKKLKIKEIREYKQIDMHFYSSFAELYYHLDHLLRFGYQELGNGSSSSSSNKEDYFKHYLPVIVLENMRCANVCPMEPKFEEVDSDDEFPSISVGKEEYKQRDRRKYVDRRPQRLPVTINVTRMNPHNGTKSTVKQTQHVYCNATAALQELFALAKNQGDKRLWIDGQIKSLHARNHACHALHSHVDQRMLSHHVREGLLWCATLQAMSDFPQLIQSRSDNPPPSSTPLLPGQLAPLPIHNFADYLAYFFPDAAQQGMSPRSLVVLGGELRVDKLRVLDELITMVDKIYLTGELALPFITLSMMDYAQFYHHHEHCQEYHSICKALISKARLVGCSLLWPEDVLVGEDPLKESERTKCDTHIIPDSRSEGADYEGEVKTINFKAIVDGTVAKKESVIPGYIYDIGPETTKSLQSLFQSSDLVVLWGTVGVCEVNNFQLSQQGLLQTLTTLKPANPSGGAVPINNGVNVVLWGEKTVEWFSRLADSDGELQGDLVRNGSIVTYMNRDSSLFRGMIGRYPSTVVQERLIYRPTMQGEWVYTNRKPEEVEDEDEEEEDEEEEDE